MSYQGWLETIAIQRSAATLFNTFTTAKTVIQPEALVSLPPNFFSVGRTLRVRASGGISNIATTPGLMNFQVVIGGVAAFDTGYIQLNATAHTTLPFWIDIELTCRAIGNGTAANLMGQAIVTGKMFTTTAGLTDDTQDMPSVLAPAIAPAVGTGFNSAQTNTLDFFVGFTISNAGNGVQIQQYKVTSE